MVATGLETSANGEELQAKIEVSCLLGDLLYKPHSC